MCMDGCVDCTWHAEARIFLFDLQRILTEGGGGSQFLFCERECALGSLYCVCRLVCIYSIDVYIHYYSLSYTVTKRTTAV